jgi:replication factor C subunit 3/5
MLWVDKHRPSKLDELTYHDTTTARLKSLAASSSLPHLLVYGPSGSGKKTRVNALLREIFGPAVAKLKLDKRTFITPTNRTVEISMVASNFHVELSPGDAGFNDRHVVQQVIREMASHKVIGTSAPYKVLVLTEVDRLTRQAQAALRRTMEKYASSCRLILVCNSPSKVMDPVRSRCLGIRVAAPTHDDVRSIFCVPWMILCLWLVYYIHVLSSRHSHAFSFFLF